MFAEMYSGRGIISYTEDSWDKERAIKACRNILMTRISVVGIVSSSLLSLLVDSSRINRYVVFVIAIFYLPIAYEMIMALS